VKFLNAYKLLVSSAIVVSLGVMTSSLPAEAQVGANRANKVDTVETRNDDIDWGWLGLLGLLGLGGLAGRKRQESTTNYVPKDREYINR
jgi:MYXO-CTERM domain-containing protein